jgi:hypothetical protein
MGIRGLRGRAGKLFQAFHSAESDSIKLYTRLSSKALRPKLAIGI